MALMVRATTSSISLARLASISGFIVVGHTRTVTALKAPNLKWRLKRQNDLAGERRFVYGVFIVMIAVLWAVSALTGSAGH